ncbi:hypothetical protein [Alkalibacillus aidingensis]|uniref:hypothetical protein n=1 Tax=Alkalibacillus aidingensis TaxID=2747607 RepID=UPI0016611565|nr:hypothetical protein [Alkalibacillus aidingensis]
MKRPYVVIALLLLIGVLIISLTSTSQQIDQSFDGVWYQLGEENADYEEPVTVEFNGELKKSLFRNLTFVGTIAIDDHVMPGTDARDDELELVFDDGICKNSETIDYIGNDRIETYGTLCVNDDFSEFMITILEQTENGGTWKGEDGQVIAGPAHSREEALRITNQLMAEYLVKPLE